MLEVFASPDPVEKSKHRAGGRIMLDDEEGDGA